MNAKARFVCFWNTSDEPTREEWHAIYKDEVGSHVSDDTLVERGIAITLTPTFRTWKLLTTLKKKCPRCFLSLRGLNDYQRHMERYG